MARTAEFCPSGNCPTASATAESVSIVVQGADTGDPSNVRVPKRLFDGWNPSQALTMPGSEAKDGIAVPPASKREETILIPGMPLDIQKPGSVPPAERMLLASKKDVAKLLGISMPKLPTNPKVGAPVAR
jgi:hypothetical protein